MHGNRLYNSVEARQLLGGISESKFRRLTASGALSAKKAGTKVVVSQRAIDAYIDSLPSAAKDDASTDTTPAVGEAAA